MEDFIGRYVISKTYHSGAHTGKLEYYNEQTRHMILSDVRRIFQFDGAFTLSELALHGVSSKCKENNVKFSVKIPFMCIYETYEIIPCSSQGEKSIREFVEWTYEKEELSKSR